MKKVIDWVTENVQSKFSFMASMGWAFIGTYLIIILYQLIQYNWFFAKEKMTIEIYERLTMSINHDLLSIVMIIVLFFFKSQGANEQKKEEIQVSETTN